MIHEDDILQIEALFARFLDGETTVEEERSLDAFFVRNANNVDALPESLQIGSAMFQEFRVMRAQQAQTAEPVSPTVHRGDRVRLRRLMAWIGVAAAAAVIAFVLLHPSVTPDPSMTAPVEILVAHTDEVSEPMDTVHAVAVPVPEPRLAHNDAKTLPTKPPKKKASAHKAEPKVQEPEPVVVHPQPDDVSGPMLCRMPQDIPPGMIPMQTATSQSPVMIECELTILEQEFQESENQRRNPVIRI